MLTLTLTVNGSSDSANFDADADAHCEWTLTHHEFPFLSCCIKWTELGFNISRKKYWDPLADLEGGVPSARP